MLLQGLPAAAQLFEEALAGDVAPTFAQATCRVEECFESSTFYTMNQDEENTVFASRLAVSCVSCVSCGCDGDSFSRRLPAVHMNSKKGRVLRRERTEKFRSEKLWDMV